MKKIFAHIFAVLAVLGLALGGISCKKDKDKDSITFNENDLIGYWACTKCDDYTNPEYSFSVSADHSILIKSGDSYTREGSWAIEGNKLVLSGEDFEGWDVTLKELDGKHLVWDANRGIDALYHESYTNISRVLPGTWKISWLNAWFIVDISDSGSSTWKQSGIEALQTYDWKLSVDKGRIVVCFGNENSGWSDKLTVNAIYSDKYIDAGNAAGGLVGLWRTPLGEGSWEVESENAAEAGSSSLYHAWYFHDDEDDAYSICFSDKAIHPGVDNCNWASVDLDRCFCGAEHSLTENLTTSNWTFYGGTKSYPCFRNGGFADGKIFLNVDEVNKTITFRLNGTTNSGVKININYEGPAVRVDYYAGLVELF